MNIIEDENEKRKIYDFLNRINTNEEYPFNIIDKLII